MGAFGPKSEQERLIFATEDLRADLQLTIQQVMLAKGITRSHLAKLLGCSPANVTQLLAENGNPTIETVARVFYALGDSCKIQSAFLQQQPPKAGRICRRADQARGSWQFAELTETESRGQGRQNQPTTELAIRLARDAARRQVEVPPHNQSFTLQQKQAA